MKHIAICFAAILGMVALASADPVCVTGTLATYEALSSGCTIGTNTVFDFNVPSGITGAAPITPASIEIIPSGGTTTPTLTFITSQTASNGQLIEALIDYSISGNDYMSDSIMLAGSSSSGNGAVTDIQNYCLGGSFDSTGVNNCSSGNTNALLLFGDGSDPISFAKTTLLNVTDDFTLDGGGFLGGSAAGGTITDSFGAIAAVPEPSTYLLLAAALLLIMLRNTWNTFRKEKGKYHA
jgi:PEP-CTERM motif